jgi:hypothetical protein
MIQPQIPKIDINTALNRFYQTSVAAHGDAGYAAGAYQIILTELIVKMPRHEQDKLLKQFEALEMKLMKI